MGVSKGDKIGIIFGEDEIAQFHLDVSEMISHMRRKLHIPAGKDRREDLRPYGKITRKIGVLSSDLIVYGKISISNNGLSAIEKKAKETIDYLAHVSDIKMNEYQRDVVDHVKDLMYYLIFAKEYRLKGRLLSNRHKASQIITRYA
jgi:hypothetical protein